MLIRVFIERKNNSSNKTTTRVCVLLLLLLLLINEQKIKRNETFIGRKQLINTNFLLLIFVMIFVLSFAFSDFWLLVFE